MSIRSYKTTCHTKICTNGNCKESNDCNVKLTNGTTVAITGKPGASGNGSGGTNTPITSSPTPTAPVTDLPAVEAGRFGDDPIAAFIRWIEELLGKLFNPQ